MMSWLNILRKLRKGEWQKFEIKIGIFREEWGSKTLRLLKFLSFVDLNSKFIFIISLFLFLCYIF